MKAIRAIRDSIDAAVLFVFSASTVILTLATALGVIMRYVVNKPLNWIEEIQMLFIVWMTFFGCCHAINEHGNIEITLLYDKFPDKVRRILDVLDWVIVAVILVAVTWLSFNRFGKLLGSVQASAVLHIPRWLQYGVVAFSCVFMIINHCLTGVLDIEKIRKGGKEE